MATNKLKKYEDIRENMNSLMNSINIASTNIKNQAEMVLKETRDIINTLPNTLNEHFSEFYRETLISTHGYEDLTDTVFETSKDLEQEGSKQLALMASYNFSKRYMELITILYRGNIFNTNNVFLTERAIDNVANVLNGKKISLGDNYKESISDYLKRGWINREKNILNQKPITQSLKVKNLRTYKLFSRLDDLIREGWYIVDHYHARGGNSDTPQMFFHLFKPFQKKYGTITTLIFDDSCAWSSETHRTSLMLDGWKKITEIWYTKLEEQKKLEKKLEKEMNKTLKGTK